MSINGWIIHKKELGENHEVERLVEELPNTYGHDVDIMVEAKHKELAIEGFIK